MVLVAVMAGCADSDDTERPSTTTDCAEAGINEPPGTGDTVPIGMPPMNSIPDATISTRLACP